MLQDILDMCGTHWDGWDTGQRRRESKNVGKNEIVSFKVKRKPSLFVLC